MSKPSQPTSESGAQPRQQPLTQVADPSTWVGSTEYDAAEWMLRSLEHVGANIWSPQDETPYGVQSQPELSSRIEALADGQHAVLKALVDGRFPFAQTIRLGDIWIVEVHDGSEDDWASRVMRGERTAPRGLLDPVESFTAAEAADIMWAWLATQALGAGLVRQRIS